MSRTTQICLIVVATLFCWVGSARAGVIVLDTFETNEGHFTSAPNASGTSVGFTTASTASTADRVTNTPANTGIGSQRIFIDDDPAVDSTSATIGGEWTLRHLSGGGTATNNVDTGSTGMIGYWYKTTTANLQGAMIIDEASSGTSNERAVFKPMIADGEWHALEWSLDSTVANSEWANFSGGNGLPNTAYASIDSLLFRLTTQDGAPGGDFNGEFWIDDVSYSTVPGESIVPEPASLGLLLMASSAALLRRRRLPRIQRT